MGVFRLLVLVAAAGAPPVRAAGAAPAPAPPARTADSIEAARRLAQIAPLEAQGRYVQAGRDYESLLADHGSDLVRTADGSYASVSRHVRDRMAAWPPDARTVLGDLWERQAATRIAALGESGEIAATVAAAQRWWLTRAAGEAALRCAERLTEMQCLDTAAWLRQQLRAGHPEMAARIAPVAVRAPGEPAGHPGLAAPPASAPQADRTTLWTSDLSGPTRAACWQDRLILQDAASLRCRRLYSGCLEWFIDLTARRGRPAGCPPRPPAVAQDRVMAVVADEDDDPPSPDRANAPPALRLVGIEAASGTPAWSLAGPPPAAQDARIDSCSDPMAYERALFIAIGQRTGAVEDVFLLRIEPADGRPAWSRHLFSRQTPPEPCGDCGWDLAAGAGVIRARAASFEARVAALTGEIEHLTLAATAPAGPPAADETVPTVEADGVTVQMLAGQVRATVRDTDPGAMLERRIRDAPKDCSRHLDLARWAIRRDGQEPRAVRALQDALACERRGPASSAPATGPATAGRTRSARGQTFDLAIEYATAAAVTDDLLALAAQAAGGLQEQVQYRLRFAAVLDRQGRPDRAIALWQEILDRDDLSAAVPQTGGPAAGAIAEAAIARLIGQAGREPYAPVEATARAAMEAAPAGNAKRFQEVIRRYPHSEAAVRASLALAAADRSVGRPRQAERHLLKVLPHAPTEARAALLAQAAECCLERGDARRGLAWLAQGAVRCPQAAIRFGGRQTTFADAHRTWTTQAATIEPPTPRLEPPLHPGPARPFEGNWTLLRPPGTAQSGSPRACDLALVQAGHALLAIEPASGQVRWRADWETSPQPVWLADDDEILLLATPYEVRALDRASGRLRWRWEASTPPRNEPLIDPEILDPIVARQCGDAAFVAACRSGRLAALDLADGRSMWEHRLDGQAGLLAIDEAQVACVRKQKEVFDLLLFDAAGGEPIGPPRPLGTVPAVAIATAPGGIVLVADAGGLKAWQADRPQPAWTWQGPADRAIAGIRPGLTEVYVYGNGFVAAVAAATGRARWQVDPFATDEPVREIHVAGGHVYAVGDRRVAAIDAGSGELRWTGEPAAGEVIASAALTPRWVVAVVSKPTGSGWDEPRELAAVFFARSAGFGGERTQDVRCGLGTVRQLQKVLLRDGAVLIQAGPLLIPCPHGPPGSAPTGPR